MKNVIAPSPGKSPSGGVEFLLRYTPPPLLFLSVAYPSLPSSSSPPSLSPSLLPPPSAPLWTKELPSQSSPLKALTHTRLAGFPLSHTHSQPSRRLRKPVHFSALIPLSFLLSFLFFFFLNFLLIAWLAISVSSLRYISKPLSCYSRLAASKIYSPSLFFCFKLLSFLPPLISLVPPNSSFCVSFSLWVVFWSVVSASSHSLIIVRQ